MTGAGGEATLGKRRGVRLVAAVLLAAGWAARPAGAQDLEAQLQEIRSLVREKRFSLALEGLGLVARQIQDLRLEALSPAFPAPPAQWNAQPAVNSLEEGEIWSGRIVAQRSYAAAAGGARIDLTIDVRSPLAPAVALGFNPLALAGDPTARFVDIGAEKGLLRFNPDTGEAELRVLVGKEVLVSALGRGLTSPEPVLGLARGVDYALLRGRSLP